MASPSSFHNPFDPAARFTLPTPQMRLRPARPEPPPLRGRALAGTGFPHSRSRWSLARPRLRKELAWLTWQTPEQHQTEILANLRQTLDWRAQYCDPLAPPKKPVERARFGLLGEALQPETTQEVCDGLKNELCETIRTLEERQPILVRNHRLAMHSVRLGQLCAELGQRGLDALEEIRSGLGRLWV